MGIAANDGALAFGLTCGAGMATTIGASIVFFPRLVHYANNKVLAGSLSIAAGVMMYVSFIEIFGKSQGGFEDAGFSEAIANLLATVCFFGGIIVGQLLNRLSHWVSGEEHDPECDHHSVDIDEMRRMLELAEGEQVTGAVKNIALGAEVEAEAGGGEGADVGMVDINNADGSRKASSTGSSSSSRNGAGATAGCASDEVHTSLDPNGLPHDDGSGSGAGGPDKELVKMGLQTALAIGIHNFPEGLATFVATLDDPIVGAGLAIAIAVHNVPEGLCVSVPIYYATRDRWQAFKWAFISGISEPIGAGLGWLVLYRTMDDNAYGVVFGLVAGMMVNICISELLPTAFKYDPKDSIVTRCFVVGMAIMALSLVLFLNV